MYDAVKTHCRYNTHNAKSPITHIHCTFVFLFVRLETAASSMKCNEVLSVHRWQCRCVCGDGGLTDKLDSYL